METTFQQRRMVEVLKLRQSYTLEQKVELTKEKIHEWHKAHNGQIYVAFSGGKDSTVLLHITRSIYPDVPGVFCDTGLEYPEIKQFVKSHENITTIRPSISYPKVLEKHGYPVVSKEVAMAIDRYRNTKDPEVREYRFKGTRGGKKAGNRGVIPQKWRYLVKAPFKISERCCDVMKKNPAKKYHKETGKVPILGTMASDSNNRTLDYYKRGCNVYDATIPQSRPISFWLESDVWEYIKKYDIPYCKIYDMGVNRTGCIFCLFGVHFEKGQRFKAMKKTHPKLFKYCMENLGLREVLDFLNIDVDTDQESIDDY